MDIRSDKKTVQNLLKDMTRYTKTYEKHQKDLNAVIAGLSLEHKYQRKEGQWNKEEKSLLIDSLIRQYPTLPIFIIKENDNNHYAVIDGVQRLSTIRDFVNDKFAISKDAELVTVNGARFDIAGKKFSKLPEEIQDTITEYNFIVYTLQSVTNDDIKQIFGRVNSGKNLSASTMRGVNLSDRAFDHLASLREKDFIQKITSLAQAKKDTDRDWLIEAIMLLETNQEYDYTSFNKKSLNNYVKSDIDTVEDIVFEYLSTAIDKLGAAYSEVETLKIPTTSVPMVLYAAAKVAKNKGNFTKFVEILNDFLENYDSNEEYKAFVSSGTSGKESVSARYEYWKGLVKGL